MDRRGQAGRDTVFSPQQLSKVERVFGRLHITFALRMKKMDHLDRLEQAAGCRNVRTSVVALGSIR